MKLHTILTITYSIILCMWHQCSLTVYNFHRTPVFQHLQRVLSGLEIFKCDFERVVTSLVILYLISFKENYIVHAHRRCENIIGTNLNTLNFWEISEIPINICPVLTLNAMIVQKHTVIMIIIQSGIVEPRKAFFSSYFYRNESKPSLFYSAKA